MRGARRALRAAARHARSALRGVVAVVAALLVVADRLRRLAHGRRVHPEPRRGRHRHARAAHSRHQPDPVGARCRRRWRRRSLEFPEVKEVFAKIGTAEVATDPDAAERRRHLRHAEAARAMARSRRGPRPTSSRRSRSASQEIPGNNYEFTQPIQMRFNELISGVRSDVGVKIFGDDLDTLLQVAGQVQSVLQTIPGAADVKTEQVTGLPVLTVKLNRAGAVALRHQRRRRAGRRRDRGRRQERRAASSRATAASTSSCACPSICASMSRPSASLPIPLPPAAKTSRRQCAPRSGNSPLAQVALRAAVGRCARSRSRRAPTRSAARTASGASSSPPTCATAISARSSPRRSARSPRR